MHQKYTTLFFDLDHTLWDFDENSAVTLKQLYQHFEFNKQNIQLEEFCTVYEAINEKMWERFRKGFMTRKDLRWKRMMQTLTHFKIGNESLAQEMSVLYLDILPQKGLLMPNAREILEYLKDKNYSMHLITNGFETTQLQKLETSKIAHYFGHLITSEGSFSMKPQPEIFQYAIDITGASSVTSVMIGDSLEADIVGAQNFGMDTIFYNPKKLPHNANPTKEIADLIKLKDIL